MKKAVHGERPWQMGKFAQPFFAAGFFLALMMAFLRLM